MHRMLNPRYETSKIEKKINLTATSWQVGTPPTGARAVVFGSLLENLLIPPRGLPALCPVESWLVSGHLYLYSRRQKKVHVA